MFKTTGRVITQFRNFDELEEIERPLDLRLITRLLRYTRPYRRHRNWLFALVLIRSIQLPCLTWFVAAILRGPVAESHFPGVLMGTLLFGLLALSTQIVMHFRQRLALELGEWVVNDLRKELFAHLQTLPMRFYHKTKVGRIISRMSSDVEDIRIGVQEVVFVSLVQVGQMAVAAGFMLWYDPLLFAFVLGLVPVLWGINAYFRRKLSHSLRRLRDSFSRVTATLAESVNGIRVTQGFVRQDENARIFGDLIADHSRYAFKYFKTHGAFIPLLDLNNQIFVAVLVLTGGYWALTPPHSVDVGDLVSFLFMSNMFFAPIANLGTQYTQALETMAGAERVFALLDLKMEAIDPLNARQLPSVRGRVDFEDVGFEYEPGRPVLRDVSLTARPGETVALVGPTGSGKSTIVNLIAKFYVAGSGRILIDGNDVRELDSHWLHRQMGIVSQQNFLFSGTIADNIRFARPEASDEEVVEAARRLGCLDMLGSLSEGLWTQVGERGGQLSMGQRQLVCFARALLADPRILILDEATSSIDPRTEGQIQRALAVLLRNRTSFVVAHRLSTIRHADQVLVLDQGRVIERGTHDILLSLGGRYAHLHQQFVHASVA